MVAYYRSLAELRTHEKAKETEFSSTLAELDLRSTKFENLEGTPPSSAHDVARRLLTLMGKAHCHQLGLGGADLGGLVEIDGVRVLESLTVARVVVEERRTVSDSFRPYENERLPPQTVQTKDVDLLAYEFFADDADHGDESIAVEGSARVARCAECQDGKVDCGECGGSGKEYCHECDSDGKVPGVRGPKICPTCRGTQRRACRQTGCLRGRVTCDACEGRTRVVQELTVAATRSRSVVGAELAHPELEPLLGLVRNDGVSVGFDRIGDVWRQWKRALTHQMEGESVAFKALREGSRSVDDDALVAASRGDPLAASLLKPEISAQAKAAVRACLVSMHVNSLMSSANVGLYLNGPRPPEEFGVDGAFTEYDSGMEEFRRHKIRMSGLLWPNSLRQSVQVVRVRKGGPKGLSQLNLEGITAWEEAGPLLASVDARHKPARNVVIVQDYDVLYERSWLVVDYRFEAASYRIVVGSSGIFSPGDSPISRGPTRVLAHARELGESGHRKDALYRLWDALADPYLRPDDDPLADFTTRIGSFRMDYDTKILALDAVDEAVQPRSSDFREFIQSTLAFKSTPDDPRWRVLLDSKKTRANGQLVRAARAKVEAARSRKRLLVGIAVSVIVVGIIAAIVLFRRQPEPSTPTSPPPSAVLEKPQAAPVPPPAAPPPAQRPTHRVVGKAKGGQTCETALRFEPTSSGKVRGTLQCGTPVVLVMGPAGPKRAWQWVKVPNSDTDSQAGYVPVSSLQPLHANGTGRP